jgi:hypothetical protein
VESSDPETEETVTMRKQREEDDERRHGTIGCHVSVEHVEEGTFYLQVRDEHGGYLYDGYYVPENKKDTMKDAFAHAMCESGLRRKTKGRTTKLKWCLNER